MVIFLKDGGDGGGGAEREQESGSIKAANKAHRRVFQLWVGLM